MSNPANLLDSLGLLSLPQGMTLLFDPSILFQRQCPPPEDEGNEDPCPRDSNASLDESAEAITPAPLGWRRPPHDIRPPNSTRPPGRILDYQSGRDFARQNWLRNVHRAKQLKHSVQAIRIFGQPFAAYYTVAGGKILMAAGVGYGAGTLIVKYTPVDEWLGDLIYSAFYEERDNVVILAPISPDDYIVGPINPIRCYDRRGGAVD